MSLSYTVEHRDSHTVVRAVGEPTLDEFLAFVEEFAARSKDERMTRALFDLRAIRSLKAFTEHYAIGVAVAQHLQHFERLASVVAADRITRASERMARQGGANLQVFTSEGEAIEWLTR